MAPKWTNMNSQGGLGLSVGPVASLGRPWLGASRGVLGVPLGSVGVPLGGPLTLSEVPRGSSGAPEGPFGSLPWGYPGAKMKVTGPT